MPRPRAVQACQLCRDRKARCLPGVTSTTCLACEKHGVRCVPHVPIKKGTNAKRLISVLSDEIQQLQTALNASAASIPQAQAASVYDNQTLSGWDNASPQSTGQWQDGFDLDATNVKTDANLIKEKLRRYNDMAIAHPFAVCIDEDQIEDQTFTETVFAASCLAILAGGQSTPISNHAEMRFRQILADQAIVNGKQSIDLLQGLLTYITWYHHCFNPETQQMYQDLQLAKAMADDLGLFDCFTESEHLFVAEGECLNYARIVTGLFSLDCIVSVVGYRKYRRLLDYSTAEKAAKYIVENGQRPTDACALDLTSLLQQTVLVVRQLESPLNNVVPQASFVTGSRHLQALDSCIQFTAGYHKLGLDYAQRLERSSADRTLPSCFENFARILADTSTVPASYLENMTLVEWAYLLSSTVLLPHIELQSNTSQAEQCLLYLNRLTARLHELWPSPESRPSHIHWLCLIIKDSTQISLGQHQPKPLPVLLRASPHDLLEELTERQLAQLGSSYTQKKKLRPMDASPSTYQEHEKWSQIMVDWLDLG